MDWSPEWVEDLDPTNPNNAAYDIAGAVPVLGPVIQSIGSKNAAKNRAEEQRRKAEARQAFYDSIGQEYQDVPGSEATTAEADRRYGLRAAEIDRGMYGATRGIARGYSQRGLGASGYNAGAQSQAVQAAAAERSRARSSALDEAIGQGQKGILGKAQISRMGDPFLMSMYSTAEQQYEAALAEAARQRDEYQKLLMKLGQMAFTGGMDPAALGAGGVTGGGMGPGVAAPELLPMG